jgi:hypothetical protein
MIIVILMYILEKLLRFFIHVERVSNIDVKQCILIVLYIVFYIKYKTFSIVL